LTYECFQIVVKSCVIRLRRLATQSTLGAMNLSGEDRTIQDCYSDSQNTPDPTKLKMLSRFLSNEGGCRCVL
jgi:hypothetical protein